MMMSATEGAAALLCAEHAAAVVQGCFVLPGYSQRMGGSPAGVTSCSGALRHGNFMVLKSGGSASTVWWFTRTKVAVVLLVLLLLFRSLSCCHVQSPILKSTQ